jgi:outer membrane protein TolC
VLALVAFTSSCVLAPRAAREEQAAAARAGEPYRTPFAARDLPAVPPAPTWRDVVARTLLANGDLEAAYYAWAAAAHRIDQAGAYPNTAFSLDVSRALSGGGSAFERTSLALGFDPMENLAFPTKVYQAAKVATDEARVAGQRLVALRFDLQRRTLHAWHAYVLLAERVRIARAKASLAALEVEAAGARVAGGAERQMLVAAESARLLATNDVAATEAMLPGARATLNAGMGREPDAPLAPPAALEPPRPLPADDAWLLGIAAARDPELATLAREVEGRRDALALARQQYIPDFNPFVGTDGAAAQMAGVVISIPTLLREVGAMVRAARAELAAAHARERQAHFDRSAAVVAALALARDAERRAALYAGPLQALAERAVEAADVAYGGEVGVYTDLLQARRTRLDVRLLAAEARTAGADAVADLEALLGVDAETLTATAPPDAVAVAEAGQ